MEDVKCHFHIYLCSPKFVKCKVLTGATAGKKLQKKTKKTKSIYQKTALHQVYYFNHSSQLTAFTTNSLYPPDHFFL